MGCPDARGNTCASPWGIAPVYAETMTDDRRFLCDEMLAGLGRWLRIAGYDTEITECGRRDRELVEQAEAEGRILLTRDRRMIEIRRARDHTLVLESNDIDACARELTRRAGVDWTLDPLSRCNRCNTRLEPVAPALVQTLPPRIRALEGPVNVCPRCGRLYWEGSHTRRIRRRLAAFGDTGTDERTE